jgi:protein TonB
VVNSRGEVTKPAIARGISEDIDKETLRVIRMMPDWEPGVHEGKPVNVAFNLPVSFKLSAEEK